MNRTHNPTAPAADTDDPCVITPADALRGAARYLDIRGWTKGDYYADTTLAFPPACALGAIAMAVYGHCHTNPVDPIHPDRIDLNDAVDVLGDYLTTAAGMTDCDTGDLLPIEVSGWNDRDETTAAQVIDAMNAAADDYLISHASDDDLETYGENELAQERFPTREGFIAWLGAR